MLRLCLAAALLVVSSLLAADKPASIYPPLPKGVSSFGAVECNHFLYVYGGHAGQAHTYSNESSVGTFLRIPVGGTKWETLPGGPRLQGLNLATAGGKVYRVGGMEARNKPGDKQDLHSTNDVAVYDPKANKWSPGVALPNGRSSHDVVGVGSKLVVVGGWEMRGSEKAVWADTALVLDTLASSPKWRAIPQPFKRRALTAAALGTKVYVIGGLIEGGESVRKVEIFDLPTGKWSHGPDFPGTERVGFSPAATVVDDRLILSTSDRAIHALNATGTAWEKVGRTTESRLVHRLVPGGTSMVVAIAGAGGPRGPFDSVEVVKLGAAVPMAANDDPKAQKYCPVMTTDEIDPKASKAVTYKGVKIYLCCDACVGKFNRDPAAYLDPKIIPALAGLDLPKRDIEQMYCPVLKDRKVSSKDPSTTYKGVKIYFYNDLARQRFEKDPERYADPKLLPQLPRK
jgi:N-acetylneuraminic acid mutarotase/YHS domain-containing protein